MKPMLREIARGLLPDEIVHRKKQGFMVPIGRWFRADLRDYLQRQLAPENLPSFLNPLGVRELVEGHLSARRNHTHLLWALLVLTRWLADKRQVGLPLEINDDSGGPAAVGPAMG